MYTMKRDAVRFASGKGTFYYKDIAKVKDIKMMGNSAEKWWG
jgi:hypothetical protein